MQEIFDLRDIDSFPLQPGLPKAYSGVHLRNSIAVSGRTSAGLVVLQNFERTDFAIQLGIYRFIHMVRCFLTPPVFPVTSILTVKNDLKSRIPEIGSFRLKEKQFSFLHFGGNTILADFKAGKEYQFLEISCSPETLTQILLFFPKLAEKFKRATTQSTSSLITAKRPADIKSLGFVRDILSSRFDSAVNEIYFEDRVREYVWSLMIEISKPEEELVHLDLTEKDLLNALGDRMQQNPEGKFPISSLAREMGMNEMTFKLAFKQVFGKGIFEYHMDQRMKEAHRLLKNSELPIKKIASMVGYELTTSFITKFMEYFGYPPSRIQQK